MCILAWYTDPNDIENKNILKYPCPIGIPHHIVITLELIIILDDLEYRIWKICLY